jgi:hypothetical protein
MRSLNVRAACLVAAALTSVDAGPARADEAAADQALPPPPSALREESPFAIAAGLDVGSGVVWPSIAASLYEVRARLGVSLAASPSITFVAGGESGAGLALSGTTPTYGYLVRAPLRFFAEGVFSRSVDYRNDRYVNLHVGGSVGSDFVLASQCQNGSCSYMTPGNYTGFGARVGLSITQNSSGVGVFVRWDNDVGGCTGGPAKCNTYVQMYTWSLGWTLF